MLGDPVLDLLYYMYVLIWCLAFDACVGRLEARNKNLGRRPQNSESGLNNNQRFKIEFRNR